MKFSNQAIATGVFIALGGASGVMAQDSISTSTPISASVQAYCTMEIDATGLTNNEGFFATQELFIYPSVACNAYNGAQFTVSGTNGGFYHAPSDSAVAYVVSVDLLGYTGSGTGIAGPIVSETIGSGGTLALASVSEIVQGTVTVTVQADTAFAGDYEETLGFTLSAIN